MVSTDPPLVRYEEFSEPLLHFVLLGALLFAAYHLVNREPKVDPQRIVVSPGQIEHMVTTFARTWQRPPTTAEVKGLIDQYVQRRDAEPRGDEARPRAKRYRHPPAAAAKDGIYR